SGACQLLVRYRPLSPGNASSPAVSQVTSTGVVPVFDGTNPRGTAERSDDEPATWIRTPMAARVEGTGPPPASSVGQRSGRAGPARPPPPAGEPRARWGTRGRAHDPSPETYRVHQHHVGRCPQAKPAYQRPGLARHAGAHWSLPGDADLPVQGGCL